MNISSALSASNSMYAIALRNFQASGNAQKTGDELPGGKAVKLQPTHGTYSGMSPVSGSNQSTHGNYNGLNRSTSSHGTYNGMGPTVDPSLGTFTSNDPGGDPSHTTYGGRNPFASAQNVGTAGSPMAATEVPIDFAA